MSWIEDNSQVGYQVFREHTKTIKVDRRATRQGFQVDNQDDEGEYTTSLPGDLSCFLYWKHGKTPTGDSPPKVEGNREFFPAEYMTEATLPTGAEDRRFGSWAQVVASVGRPEGLFPIRTHGGKVDTQYAGKKIVNTAVANNPEKIKTAIGANSPHGFPGLAVQCANQDAHEEIFFPSGGLIAIDHLHGGLSTKVLPVKSTGWLDTAKLASLDAILRVVRQQKGEYVPAFNMGPSGKDSTGHGPVAFGDRLAYLGYEKGGPIHPGDATDDAHKQGVTPDGKQVNPVHLWTESLFYKDKAKDGPIEFSDLPYPAGAVPVADPDYTAPVTMSFDATKKKWRAHVAIDSGETSLILARILWNYVGETDLSEAQIVTLAPDGDPIPTTTLVWIDYRACKAVDFETAGNGTIFELKRIKKFHKRNGTTRDLYRATHCRKDEGKRITHFQTTNKIGNLAGKLLSSDTVAKPWTAAPSAVIKTEIGVDLKENKVNIRVPAQWNTNAAENYNYLEYSDAGRGLPMFFRPIRPQMENPTTKVYASAEKIGASTIAKYRLE